MDGLIDFEKRLAQAKADKEGHELKDRRHRHRHRHRHNRERRDGDLSPTQDREKGRERRGRRDQSTERGEYKGNAHLDGREGKNKEVHERNERGSDEEESHCHKRTRHSRHDGDVAHESRRHHTRRISMANGGEGDPKYISQHDPERNISSPGDGKPVGKHSLSRDSWMTAPSGVDIDYVHRQRGEKTPQGNTAPRHQISTRELNSEALQHINHGKALDELGQPCQSTPSYTFGDEGSQWRMTKLERVYTVAKQSGRSVDEVAAERFATLQDFDEAREEKSELERRSIYGKGYAAKNHPSGNLYKERLGCSKEYVAEVHSGESGDVDASEAHAASITEPLRAVPPVDRTTLNRLRAQLMKAKLRKTLDVARLEHEYNEAIAAFSSGASSDSAGRAVVLDASHSRMLAGTRGEVKSIETRRGKERGLVEANESMSIEDMVREERRTRGAAGGEGLRIAERIAKDSKFDDNLDYLDENADKLAKHVHKSEANLKNAAVHEIAKMNKVLESCPLCHHEDRQPPQDLPLAPIISLATRVFLTLPTEPELTGAEGGAVIVPIDHHINLLECSDDEWEEIRNFMKSLTRLYHDQGRDVIFYENAATPQRRMHAALVAVPIPYELGDTVPAFFREAVLAADEEWSQHKKIIDTGKRAREGLGKLAFRKSIATEMPYFHVWFSLDGGLGHIVEDAARWPKGDLFAREVVGGMLDVDMSIIKCQGRWTRNDLRLGEFQKRWRKFDWTRIFSEV